MATRTFKAGLSRSRTPPRKLTAPKAEPVDEDGDKEEDEQIYQFADAHAMSEEELSLLLHSNPNTVAKIMEYVTEHPG